ncbi:MAG: gephyrin-like molybdotransferase Glp [Nocardioidaceae bacterium]
MASLIAVDEARRRVLAEARPLPAEEVPLLEALGRVLAEPIVSGMHVPPFDSSAMDGVAVVAGPGGERRVIGESRAGRPARERVTPDAALRVSTGAELPAGANAVVPVERLEWAAELVRVPDTTPGENVRRAGEDVRAGDVALPAGARLGPAELGVAAALGRARVRCAARPRLALAITGDELTEPGEPLGGGRIFNSNAYALAAQAARAGATLARREAVPDTADATREALALCLAAADVVCVSGGVSVGEHDHVKAALAALGVEERFWGVALKPGKPTWFGVRAGTLVFGLPGNPVSAMVTFELLVRPALRALQGADPEPRRAAAVLDEPLERSPGREQAVRVRLRARDDGWHAEVTGAQGSHRLTSMLGADALARVPRGEGALAPGERVEIELL